MITMASMLAARRIVRPHIWPTPLARSADLSTRTGGQVLLKLECWQRTGSFKVRGALNKLDSLSLDERARGIVTASAGNHGLGVAYASQVVDVPSSEVFVPESAPQTKINRLRAYDCLVRRAGTDYDTCHAIAEAYSLEHGLVYISAYDDPVVIAGQGTVGLEILEALPDVDLLLVPVGGGGLIAGIALAAKAIRPSVHVVGIQPDASPAAYLSFRDGRPYETYDAAPTICDGLAGGFGRLPFEVAAKVIDEIVVVPEADTRRAVGWLLSEEQLVVEGAGAIAVAPLLSGQIDVAGRRTVAVLTGRNLDASLLQSILKEYTQS
jgi:threonine dehydratase